MSSDEKKNTFPKDYQVIKSIMNELGIEDFDESVIKNLLGFHYKYSTMVLEDARRFSTFANKDNIDVDDVKLALHFVQDQQLIKPPERQTLISVSREVNKKPLPQIKNNKSLRIPQDCTLTSDYRLKTVLKNDNDVGNTGKPTITTAAEILEVANRKKTKNINNAYLDMDDSIQFNLVGEPENQLNTEDLFNNIKIEELFHW